MAQTVTFIDLFAETLRYTHSRYINLKISAKFREKDRIVYCF